MAIQKILVVDDSPTERYFLTDVLVKMDFLFLQQKVVKRR